MDSDFLLVGCVSEKHTSARQAKDLYSSELFRRRRSYAEKCGRPWFILSALHGLVDPEAVIEPYDLTLKRLSRTEQTDWGLKVVHQLEARLGVLRDLTFEIHAGKEYVEAVGKPLENQGAGVIWPLRGLRIGEQLQWYGKAAAAGERKLPR